MNSITMIPLKKTLGNLGNALQKINKTVNFAHMIDLLERQNEVAACLKVTDTEEDEQERQRLCREATAACLKELHEHCLAYLKSHPEDASYEKWIREFHPDNVELLGNVDHRFYVQDSDHRIIWNSYCDMQDHPEWKVDVKSSQDD